MPNCPKCSRNKFKHLHDTAYGMQETHLSGTERFECENCGYSIYSREGIKMGFTFFCDKEK